MKSWPYLIGIAVLAAIVAVWFVSTRPQPQPTALPVVQSEAPPQPTVQHPVQPSPQDVAQTAPLLSPQQPLPALKESDVPMGEVLARLFAERKLDRFFILDHFIERFVVTVDNLPNPQLPNTHLPVKSPKGHFLAQPSDEQFVIDPANARRYTPLIELLSALDAEQVVAVYKRLYPLFQQAYQGLGYPDGYFNDRLVEVIDHLLSTPQVQGPVLLVRPKGLYLFADPELEALSAGRKIMLRIGPRNAERLRPLLRDYRRLLTQ
jgi:hypothetical protein